MHRGARSRHQEGFSLAESEVGARSGLNVITLQQDGQVINNPAASTKLQTGAEMVLLGTAAQRQAFQEEFGDL